MLLVARLLTEKLPVSSLKKPGLAISIQQFNFAYIFFFLHTFFETIHIGRLRMSTELAL
jgi:hypothetical protein